MAFLISRRRTRLAATAAGLVAIGLTAAAGGTTAAGVAAAGPLPGTHLLPQQGPGGGTLEAYTAAEQFAQARTAPGLVSPGAYDAAFASMQGLAQRNGKWSETTDVPYDSDDVRYRDPNGNSQGGQGLTTGRVVALAQSPNGRILYAGAANGGVFSSRDGGTTWLAISDALPSLSVGDLAVAPDGAIWLATGEANTGGTSYAGSGIYRLPEGGRFTPKLRVGDTPQGNPLAGATINKVFFDGAGSAYAATSRGLYRTGDKGGDWTAVLVTNPDALSGSTASNAPYQNIVNDVVSRPGKPSTVLAAAGWRSAPESQLDAYGNGFWISEKGGAPGTFTRVDTVGIDRKDIGNTTFAYSADGGVLYALVQSPALLNSGAGSNLAGVFRSRSGDVRGPWERIANSGKLARNGSALNFSKFYQPGVQAWYNQFLAVDPKDSQHLYMGLEEVYESHNGGTGWTAAGPYWNFGFGCWDVDPAKNTCPLTSHPDQHDVVFAGDRVYVGNDGGVYSRPTTSRAINANGNATDWRSDNADLRSLQYYAVGAGRDTRYGGAVVSGGLQDNGGSVLRAVKPDGTSTDPGDGLLYPAGAGGPGKMGSNFGGDGGDVIVDPKNGCNVVQEYVYLSMRKTITECGQSDGTKPGTVSIAPLDAAPRFIAPFEQDTTNPDHWFAGGNSVWFNPKGFAIADGREWIEAANLGANPATGALYSTTAVASAKDVAYAGYCGTCNNAGFTRGMVKVTPDGKGGFTKTALAANGLPNRYLSGIYVDPAQTDHVLVAVNGFSRKFSEGPGAGIGHLFESTDGGQNFTDVSGNLPDVPANDVLVDGGKTYLATDLGVLVADAAAPGTARSWLKLGGNLPAVTVMDLSKGPDGIMYAATHSRGIWGWKL